MFPATVGCGLLVGISVDRRCDAETLHHAGQILAGFNIRFCHLLADAVTVCRGLRQTRRRRQIVKSVSNGIILRHALASGVQAAQTVLRAGIALIRCLLVPGGGLFIILRYALA